MNEQEIREIDDGTCWLISQNKEKEDVYRPILLDERNNGMIQGVVTEVTKSTPKFSQTALSRRLNEAEKRMPSKKKLMKAIAQTYEEGLWCSFLYQIYINFTIL